MIFAQVFSTAHCEKADLYITDKSELSMSLAA